MDELGNLLPVSRVLSYYALNKYSIHAGIVIVIIMFFTILICKLYVYSELFRKVDSIYPPSFYFLNWDECKKAMHKLVNEEGFSNQESVDVSHESNSKEISSNFLMSLSNEMIKLSDKLNTKLFAFAEERLIGVI